MFPWESHNIPDLIICREVEKKTDKSITAVNKCFQWTNEITGMCPSTPFPANDGDNYNVHCLNMTLFKTLSLPKDLAGET